MQQASLHTTIYVHFSEYFMFFYSLTNNIQRIVIVILFWNRFVIVMFPLSPDFETLTRFLESGFKKNKKRWNKPNFFPS